MHGLCDACRDGAKENYPLSVSLSSFLQCSHGKTNDHSPRQARDTHKRQT
jgi:hypothetical protein